MTAIYEAYDFDIYELIDFYRRLNRPITYPDGMVTSLGIIYWGKEEHYADLENAILRLRVAGIHRLSELLEAIHTPRRMTKFSLQTGISPAILRILKHDIDLWLPKSVPLAEIELLQKYSEPINLLAEAGIRDQLQLISAAQTSKSRKSLSKQTDIPLKALVEIAKICDIYRLGSNLKYIRTKIYYELGLDTWQKWAGSTSEEIIAMFIKYIQGHDLRAARLVPFPKEVRNGIEWARQHLSIYAIAW